MKKNILGLLLTAALGASAASTFTVTGSGSTFTITRSGEGTNAAETVYYRTVPLTAFPGQHFTATNGVFTFAAGQTKTNVVVSERSPGTDVFKYQTAASRAYRLQIVDPTGTNLVYRNRTVTSGLTQFSGAKVSNSIANLVTLNSSGNFSSGMDSGKYLDVS